MSSLIDKIIPRLRASRFYRMASGFKWALKDAYNPFNRVIKLEPREWPKGRVLLSHRLEAFLFDSAKPISHDHPYYWHSGVWEFTEMARSFLELGYAVDIINYQNDKFLPRDRYAIFLDSRHNMQRLAPLLPKECLKILHIDAAHTIFMNAAESQRLLALQQRRGVTLRPQRFEWPNLGIEYADCATILGNRFTAETFAYAGKPIYRVPISNAFLYPWLKRDFEACRKHFMWLGSRGLVHKGLDLVLEAFAGMPDFELTVCGPVSEERDFEDAYKRELYDLANIHTIGWIDLGSPKFLNIIGNCLSLVYPSCSEGGGGSVITALAGGLIPVLTYESSVDVHDFGIILSGATVNDIRRTVRDLAGRSPVELETMARKGWQYVRDHHSRDSFITEWRRALKTMLNQHKVHTSPRPSRAVELSKCSQN